MRSDLLVFVAILGLVGMGIGSIALVKGRLDAFGLTNRKRAAGLAALGFAWFLTAGILMPNDGAEDSSDATPEQDSQDQASQSVVKLALASNVWETVDSQSIDIVGSTEPGAVVTATWDGGNSSSVADSAGAFRVHVEPLTKLGNNRVEVSAAVAGKATSSEYTTVHRKISESKFKSMASTIPYDQLKKDPDSLIGRIVTYKAKIFQYDSRTSTSSMIVSITNEGYGFWTDNVYLLLDPALGANADENDLIQIWGTVTGSITYGTAIGGSNTIPEVEVVYFNVTKKQ